MRQQHGIAFPVADKGGNPNMANGQNDIISGSISSENTIIEKHDLLVGIFPDEEERHDYNLLHMGNAYSNAISVVQNHMACLPTKEISTKKIPQLTAEASNILKGIEDVKTSDMLIADFSGIDKDVMNKLRDGVYHIADSAKEEGNLRAAIVDAKNKIKAQITLTHYQNNSALLADVNSLAIQKALQKISEQLENISIDIKYLKNFVRREFLHTPYFNAREYIRKASVAETKDDENTYLEKAEDELIHGLNSLYSDLWNNIQSLVNLHQQKKDTKYIDACLQMIYEDMRIIPQYVGLRVYLLCYREKTNDAYEVLSNYQIQIRRMNSEQLSAKGLTAIDLIHKYFRYSRNNRNYWISQTEKVVGTLSKFGLRENISAQEIYRLSVEVT